MRERTLWRRSVRAAYATVRQIRRGGVALPLGVPLAFGAINIPSEAMNIFSSSSRFDFFTTEVVKRDFLAPRKIQTPRTLTLEVMREQFFQTEVPYGPIIYREALKNDLPPELVAAVVEAESDFRPRLISGKNAQGLMQIIPETGRLLGCEHPFDAGAKYLRYLFDRFGDQRVAIAAYNAGEGNIEKFGGVPPFPETRNYIRRVSSRAREYRNRVQESYLFGSRVQVMYGH